VADIVDRKTRSRMMSGIRGKDTKPEILVRSLLHRSGFRFRLHARDLPGRPDIVLPKYRAVVNVMGCFWHCHECEIFRWPSTRRSFWRQKILSNRERDDAVEIQLLEAGWRIATVWECALRGKTAWDPKKLARILSAWIRGKAAQIEIEPAPQRTL
jgi:DNA mismatch endonuclease (patch repair protein)